LLASHRVTASVDGAHAAFTVRPTVRHERLEDEVIAIDLESGAYFALDDVAAVCWSILAAGGTVHAAVDATLARFDVASETAQRDVEHFVDELVRVGLLGPADRPPERAPAPDPAPELRAYEPPAIERFDDLEELLVLDPIHEVDEAGWPATPADR
jgi:Coenzyme PQQ synthesis protein D (PqqD)